MPQTYSTQIIQQLRQRFSDANLYRAMRTSRHEPGDNLDFEITSVETSDKAQVKVVIENFVGGGYAGQVYKVKVVEIDDTTRCCLQVGNTYAMKILIPPSNFGRIFRNTLYWIGFSAPFQQQVNPTAAREGALWQKFIRRAAKIRFNSEEVVNNVHATFVDRKLGSCGEISDWIDGRTWRLEVDDHMDLLRLYEKGTAVDESKLGSEEFRAKKKFMADFVELLHDLGAYEFARQYEWSTCKSQPNVLKLKSAQANPEEGLTAVDFRAGLTLLPFLPMSPGDFKLISRGFKRGSIVQFDRGDINKLKSFVEAHSEQFIDMAFMLEELKTTEKIYRNSIPDITHNRIRLLHDAQLWSTIFDGAITGWRTKNIIDESREREFLHNRFHTFIFCLLGFIPFLGKLIRRLWVSSNWRKHYSSLIKDFDYFQRAVKGKICEKLISWYRSGRVSEQNVTKLADNTGQFLIHLPLSILPASLHRFLTDKQFLKDKLHYIFVRPFKLYFSSSLREQWLRDMVEEGKKKHILTDEDADTILSQLDEPYIQRYLVSLVVHLMTLPLTQIVSVIVAWIYYMRTGDEIGAGGILVLFQIVPISPGSLARGLYAVGIATYDRSFKDYNIAVFLSFFKYIGYLGFPIQMTYRYPALARFMASHWATEAVHIVPVFGERGALLEHWVFCLFYNWPLTIRRRMASRAEIRAKQPPQYKHIPLCILVTALVFAFIDWMWLNQTGTVPSFRNIWYATAIFPAICGSIVTLYAGGLVIWKRFLWAAATGLSAGLLYTVLTALIAGSSGLDISTPSTWPFRLFFFAVFACIGAIITELRLPDPQLERREK